MHDDNFQDRLGGASKFRELGEQYGYGNGISILARAWAERTHGVDGMASWLEEYARHLRSDPVIDWVPVTARLPEPGWYLVTYNEGTVEDDIEKMWFSDGLWMWGPRDVLVNQSWVLAWRPLPEPWRGEGA